MLKTKNAIFKLWIILSIACATTALILSRPQYADNELPLFQDLFVTPIFVVGFSVLVSSMVQVLVVFFKAKGLDQLSLISVSLMLVLSYLILHNILLDIPNSLLMFIILGSIAIVGLHFSVGLMINNSGK